MNPLVNVAAYQVLWFSLVLGAGQGLHLLGPLLLLAWLPLHMRLTDSVAQDLRLFALLVIGGPLLDTAFIQAGIVAYEGAAPVTGYAPFWIIAMWGTFALTLRHSMRWVLRQPLVTLLFGLLGAPLAYIAGSRLGAAELSAPLAPTLFLIAIGWAAFLLLVRLPTIPQRESVPV